MTGRRHHRYPDGSGLAIDAATADQLLDGVTPGDLAAAYVPVDRVLAALRAPATATELAGEDAAVAIFTAARREDERRTRVAAPWPGATRQVTRRVTARRPLRVAALTAAFVVLGGGAIAAADGALPGPLQDIAHDALGLVGVKVPGDAAAPGEGTDNGGSPRNATGGNGGAGANGDSTGGERGARAGNGADADAAGPGEPGTDGSEAPGASGTAPGRTGETPGQGGEPPGQSGTAPGQSGTAAGQGATPPGQAGTPPGQTGTPPGQAKK
jgi:hypothetical protein